MCQPSWLLLTLADEAYQKGKPRRLGGGNVTAADGLADPTVLSPARVIPLESNHQRAKTASARVSKSHHHLAESGAPPFSAFRHKSTARMRAQGARSTLAILKG